MNEVLSQNEIDKLLHALSSGEIIPEASIVDNKDKTNYKKYDVRSPKRFSKDDIRILQLVHEDYARIVSSYLTAQIRTSVKANVELVDQVTYEEFIKSISAPTILCSYKMPPFAGTLLFETNPQFVFQVIDIMLGGKGTTVYKARDFTEIEKNIIRSVDSKLIGNLKMAWEETLKVEPELLGIETNPALNLTMAPNDPVALIMIGVNINGIKSMINLCIPYLSIENTFNRHAANDWRGDANARRNPEERKQIEKDIRSVPLDVDAVLGTAVIPLRDFVNLQVGDVIELERSAEETIDLLVSGKPHFKVVPGTFKKNRAVKVVEIIDKDVEEYE